jgi:hypothetical protein
VSKCLNISKSKCELFTCEQQVELYTSISQQLDTNKDLRIWVALWFSLLSNGA